MKKKFKWQESYMRNKELKISFYKICNKIIKYHQYSTIRENKKAFGNKRKTYNFVWLDNLGCMQLELFHGNNDTIITFETPSRYVKVSPYTESFKYAMMVLLKELKEYRLDEFLEGIDYD